MPLDDLVFMWLQEEEAGGEQDALALYQRSLGELLLLLAGEAPAPPSSPATNHPALTTCPPSLCSGAPRPEAGAASH